MLSRSSSWLSVLACAAVAVSCSTHQEQASTTSANWLTDGMIAISRPLPGISSAPSHMLGFMPMPPVAHSGAWLSIDTAKRVLRVMDGDKEIAVSSGEGFENLKPGTYHVLHKQRNALWYAPDSYFSSRGLPVPAQGDRSRFRRGALGEFVLYVDKETPIHSGPVWSAEVGGVRLGSADLSRMYYSLDVGSPIEVR